MKGGLCLNTVSRRGTSAEGGPLGTPNEVAWFNGISEMPIDLQMKWYDAWGTEQVDGKIVDTKKMEKTLPMILQWHESLDIGSE